MDGGGDGKRLVVKCGGSGQRLWEQAACLGTPALDYNQDLTFLSCKMGVIIASTFVRLL